MPRAGFRVDLLGSRFLLVSEGDLAGGRGWRGLGGEKRGKGGFGLVGWWVWYGMLFHVVYHIRGIMFFHVSTISTLYV
jgi:hypothetical protein